MNSFLNPNNRTSLTGIVDITAHSISLVGENDSKHVNDMFIPKTAIRITEPIDVQIDENGDNVITMYQFIGVFNDNKVPGLESVLSYMNENFVSKDEPAVNEHHYHITKKQHNEDIHNIYNIYKNKSYSMKNNRYTDGPYYHKKQFINHSIVNNITKKSIINNTDNILNIKKDYSTKNYISNNYKSQIDYIENNQ